MNTSVQTILHRLWVSRRFVMIFGGALVLSSLVRETPLYDSVHFWLLDRVHELTAPEVFFNDALLVDIGEESLALLEPELGPWPYRREIFAQVTRYLHQAGARSIVFDIVFAEKRQGDTQLASAITGTGNVYLASRGQRYQLKRSAEYHESLERMAWTSRSYQLAIHWPDFLIPNVDLARIPEVRTGVISIPVDEDGKLRRIPLLHEAYGRYLPSLPLAALFPDGQPAHLEYRPNERQVLAGDYRWPVDDQGRVVLRFPRNSDAIPVLAFHKLVRLVRGDKVPGISAETFRDRTVFVGSTAAILGDYAYVPIHGRMAGLGLLAFAHLALKHGQAVRPPSTPWNLVMVFLAGFLPLLVTNRRDYSELRIIGIAGFSLFLVATLHLILLGWFDQETELAYPMLFGVLVLAVQLVVRMQTLARERQVLYYEKKAADEANALKSRFLSHMTHELRTPLTAIMGYNQLLAEGSVSEDERRHWVRIIDTNGQHLMALINNLLDQSKIEAGRMSVERRPVFIRDLVQGILDTLDGKAREKGLRLYSGYQEALPEQVLTDELRLRQILINLGGNAIKFTEQGGVWFQVRQRADLLEIDVRDTGIGMDQFTLAKVFEAFQQAGDGVARTHGGTGLGLTVSRNLARLLGGDLTARSRPGFGTTFTLALKAPAIASSKRDAASNRETSTGQMTVLVIDDSEDIRNLLVLYLKKMGCRVLQAENGQQGVEIALARHPALVLADRNMPVMDGFAAARALREQGFDAPLIALTADTGDAVTREAREAGFDACLAKPVNRAELTSALKRYRTLAQDAPTTLTAERGKTT